MYSHFICHKHNIIFTRLKVCESFGCILYDRMLCNSRSVFRSSSTNDLFNEFKTMRTSTYYFYIDLNQMNAVELVKILSYIN